MIFEHKSFVDEAGQSIVGRYALIGQLADVATLPPPAFFAAAVVNMPLPGGQVAQKQFQFDIPGTTPDEAFANLPAALEAGKVKAEAEIRAHISGQQIIVPGGAVPPGLRANGNRFPY